MDVIERPRGYYYVPTLDQSLTTTTDPSLVSQSGEMTSSNPQAQVSASDLHTPSNSPSELRQSLSTPSGERLTERQATHLAVVLDMFQAKGTMAKMNDYFVDDAVYEDLFATCKNRDEVGESPLCWIILAVLCNWSNRFMSTMDLGCEVWGQGKGLRCEVWRCEGETDESSWTNGQSPHRSQINQNNQTRTPIHYPRYTNRRWYRTLNPCG